MNAILPNQTATFLTLIIPFLIITNFMLLVLGDTLGTKFFSLVGIDGSVGSIIVLLLWLNMSCLIVYIGGEINAIIAYLDLKSSAVRGTKSSISSVIPPI